MITSKIISNGILRALATILIIAVVLYFLYEIQTVIVYLCISLNIVFNCKSVSTIFKK